MGLKPENGPCTDATAATVGRSDCVYRVQIHRTGDAAKQDTNGKYIDDEQVATFKWSRVDGVLLRPSLVRKRMHRRARSSRLVIRRSFWRKLSNPMPGSS